MIVGFGQGGLQPAAFMDSDFVIRGCNPSNKVEVDDELERAKEEARIAVKAAKDAKYAARQAKIRAKNAYKKVK